MQRPSRLAPAAVVALAAIVYWRTAYPTIAWWDSADYSLAAVTLGITSSPGSLVLTLVGWLATRVPVGSPAHLLNLVAGAIAAATVGLVYGVGRRLGDGDDDGAAVGAAAGALAFAFAPAVWEYAVQFTPYAPSALFTGLLWLALVRWWAVADRPDAWRRLALVGLLFGLDFSVHRTNALLVPATALWVLLRHPRTLRRPSAWLGALGALAVGLSLQLLVMPIAAHTRSPLVMLEPTTWSRFWDYVSLAQVGGGFLVDVWPRKAPLWSAQVMDLLRVIGAMGWLPLLAAAFGVATLRRRDRRLAAAFVAVLLVQACLTVLYFNIPASYFRSLHRHYLPVLVTVGIAAAVGLAELARRLAARRAALAVAIVPAVSLAVGWRAHDASRRWFARDYAESALATLPPRAILFTAGDNDTFPLWYLQSAEGVRPDVRVVNLSLLNAGWYVRQIARRDPVFPAPAPDAPDRRADAVVRDAERRNAGRDPLCFSTTVPPDMTAGLSPRLRLAGLHACVAPDTAPDVARLRDNLLARHRYRGYADPSVVVDDVSRMIGALHLSALDALLRAESREPRCRDDARRVLSAVPPERVGLTPRDRAELVGRCGG